MRKLASASMKDPRKREPHKQSNSYARHCVFFRLIRPKQSIAPPSLQCPPNFSAFALRVLLRVIRVLDAHLLQPPLAAPTTFA